MRNNSLSIVVSLVLLAGTLTACGSHRHDSNAIAEYSERIVEHVSCELELNELQQSKLDALKTKLLAMGREHRDQRDAEKKTLLTLLGEPTLDRQRAEALVQEHFNAVQSQTPGVITLFADFYDSLEPAQQKELHDRVASRLDRSHWY